MTETAATPDPTMEAIGNALALGRGGDPEVARRDLLALWREIGVAGDPFHRCTLAHHLADLYEEPAEAFIWDVCALDAADALTDERTHQHHATLQVSAFYPGLYLTIADNLRRLGTFEAATEHLNHAQQHTSALSEDAYGITILTAISEVREAIDTHDIARRASAPGDAR